jgi:YD repeat-containing protein
VAEIDAWKAAALGAATLAPGNPAPPGVEILEWSAAAQVSRVRTADGTSWSVVRDTAGRPVSVAVEV